MNKTEINNLRDGTKIESPSGVEYETASHRCGNQWLQQTRKNKYGESFGAKIMATGTDRTFEGWEIVK